MSVVWYNRKDRWFEVENMTVDGFHGSETPWIPLRWRNRDVSSTGRVRRDLAHLIESPEHVSKLVSLGALRLVKKHESNKFHWPYQLLSFDEPVGSRVGYQISVVLDRPWYISIIIHRLCISSV